MSIFKDTSNQAVFDYFDTVIYPDQFKQVKNGTLKLQNHIIQITKGHGISDKGILQLLRRYVSPDYTHKQMLEALAGYNQSWKSICNYDYFTKTIEVLDDEAFEYYTGSKNYRRTIKPIEYRFVLNKLSTIIFKNSKNGRKSGVAYDYFLKEESGITDDYKKVCHKSIIRSTLNHILKHLEHHKLIHRVGNARNSYYYHIGPANPMYALSIVPDLDDSELNQVNLLTAKEREYRDAMTAVLAENEKLKARVAELEAQLYQEPDMVETSTETCFDNMGLRFEGGQVHKVSRDKGYGNIPDDYFLDEV